MITSNKITKGLQLSVDSYYQPEGTVIRNHNGQFIHYDDGSFKWKSAKGNVPIDITINGSGADLSTLGLQIKGMDVMNQNLIILARKSTVSDYLGKIVFTSDDLTTATYYHIIEDEDLGLQPDRPIRQFYCSYENKNVQRVYWNDGVLPPRTMNIADVPSNINVDMFNFMPPQSLGKMRYSADISGQLYCGSYSFMFRLISSDGAATDYSDPVGPINIAKKRQIGQGNYYKYHNYQGDNYTQKSSSGIRLMVDDIDTSYKYIQIVVFRSIAENEYQPGVLIFDEEIEEDGRMYFYYRGSENLGSVSNEEVNITTRFLEKAEIMEFVKDKNVIANFTERAEIPETSKIKYNKVLGVSLDCEMYYIPGDDRYLIEQYNQNTDGSNDKALHGAPINHIVAYKNQWYYNTLADPKVFFQGDGEIYRYPEYTPYIRIKKYEESDGTIAYKSYSLNNEFLNYKGKKVSAYLRGYMGQETYRLGIMFYKNGKPYAVRHIGDRHIPIRNQYWALTAINAGSPYYRDHIMLRIMSIVVNNLDLSDLVTTNGSGDATDCLIDGFSIVRCPVDRQIVSNGILTPMVRNEDIPILRWPSETNASLERFENLYTYYSPEILFDKENTEISAGDKLRVLTYYLRAFTDNDDGGPAHTSDSDYVNKYVFDRNGPSEINSLLPADGDENTIEAIYDFPFSDIGDRVTVVEKSLSFKNESAFTSGRKGRGTDCKLIVTENYEAGDGYAWASWKDNVISVVSHVDEKENLYGGTSDAALAGNVYISTGHYQEITTSILNSIKKSGKFVFNNVQIFGGDTYVTMWDIARIIKYRTSSDGDFFSHGMILPIETRVNTELRKGAHLSKDRSYHGSYNTSGIGLEGGYVKLEDFNYNDAYSTDKTGKIYLPLPLGYKPSSESPFNIIWSENKNVGEKIDNYRIFPVNNTKAVNHSFGKITYIANGDNKLIYLQERGIGYLPIDERVTLNSPENQPIQLGLGGTFDRYDTTNKFYGCQHYFSACKVPNGIVFFDFDNRAFVYLKDNMQLNDQSIIKGLEPFFNELDINLKSNDNPQSSYGIFSYYDKRRKETVMVFKQPNGDNIAVTFNDKLGIFTGTLDCIPEAVTSKYDVVISALQSSGYLYAHELGNDREFYGVNYDAYLKFVVNNEKDSLKIFDNYKVIGNNNFFNQIKFKGENFEQLEDITDNNGNMLSDYAEYVNFEWRGSYPISDLAESYGARMRGHYAEVEFIIDKDNQRDIQLLEFITLNRKVH
jgi:hypothetical protein